MLVLVVFFKRFGKIKIYPDCQLKDLLMVIAEFGSCRQRLINTLIYILHH